MKALFWTVVIMGGVLGGLSGVANYFGAMF